MKKAPPVRLSLRKLFIAMLAVGPISILPSPLLAAVPQGNTAPYTVLNGSASWNGSGSLGTVTASDRAIVSWNPGSFNVASGETFSFLIPAGGAILNKVGYTSTGAIGSADSAIINGTLTSTGRVFVLANGNIMVGPGAVINTAGGLVLSTLAEPDNFTFATSGNLSFTGTSSGSILLGNFTLSPSISAGATGAQVNVAGSLGAWAGDVMTNNLSVTGDLIINQRSTNPLILTGPAGNTTVNGNLTIVAPNASVTQGASPIINAGASSVATFNGNGTQSVTLTNALNNFGAVTGNLGSLNIKDADSIVLGASTIGTGGLSVTALNNITTSGTVTVAGSANLVSTQLGNITFANNSTVAGTLNATAAGGNVTINTVGNLTTGEVSAPYGGSFIVGPAVLTSGGTGYTGTPTVTISGGGGTGATASVSVNTTTGQVTGVNILTVGTGYTSTPTLVISGGGTNPATAATATVSLVSGLSALTITSTNGGAGYSVAPSVTISGGGGTGATATAVISSGVVTSFNITSNGSGYTSNPTVTFGSVGGVVTEANASAIVPLLEPGSVSALVVTGGGTGYTGAPTVTFGGGGGTGAAATSAIGSGAVTGFTVGTAGTGYTSAPTVTLTGFGNTPTQSATFNAPVVPASTVNISTTGTVTIGGNTSGSAVTVTAGTIGANVTGFIASSGPATFNSTAGNIILPGASSSRFEVNSTGGTISQFGTSVLTSGGTTSNFNAGANGSILLTNNNALTGANVQLTANNATLNNTQNFSLGTSSIGGNLTLNTVAAAAGSGNVTLGSLLGSAAQDSNIGGNLNINTNFGTINDDPASVVNVFGSLNLNTVPTGVLGTISASILTGGTGYTATPTVTISGGGGTGATASVTTVGGVVTGITVTSLGTSYTSAPTIVISGVGSGATASGGAGGNVSFTAASAGVTGGGRYGTFNVLSGTVNINENTTLAAGTITGNNVTLNSTAGDLLLNGTLTANTLSANANAGAIIQGATGVANIASTSNFRSSNSFGTNLSSTANSFGGAITITNGLTNIIVAGSNLTLAAGSNVTGANSTLAVSTVGSPNNRVTATGNVTRLTINSGGNVLFSGGTFNTLNVTANETGANSITQGAAFTTNGTVTLNAAGNVTLATVGNNLTGNVIINTGGDTQIVSARNLTISGNSTGTLTAAAGFATSSGSITHDNTFANPWNLFLGNLNVQGLNVGAANGNTTSSGSTGNGLIGNSGGGVAAAGNSGNITQLANTSLHVEGLADIVTFNGDIVLANNGNSFGRVQASTGGGIGLVGSGNITLTEDSTMKVGLVLTNSSATLNSRFGSILEDSVNNVIITANGTSSLLTLNAPAGSVQVGGLSRTSGTTTGDVVATTINAAGSAQVQSSGNITLGTVNANSLAVTGNNIAQSAPLNIFGLSTFNATNSIALTNAGNNFGPLSLTTQTANQSITVTEANTLNLRSVNMPGGSNTSGGTFTATSLNGDVIDTGLGGVRMGGAIVNGSAVTGQGVVTLSATNGNIIIDDPTSDVLSTAGVVFNANNVTISVLGSVGGTLVLGANATPSVATGNLVASSALGNIGNAGPLTVSGNAFFQTGNGNITIGQNGNVGFGTLRFVGNQVSISETGSMDILTGSTAFGPASFVSGGSISVIDAGGGPVTFGNTVSMSATGNITLKLLQSVGTVALNATGTKDMSALSLSTDLNSKTPIFGGTGANVDPKP